MILIIDDDTEYLEELKKLLILSGHSDVRTESTMSEGCAAALNLHPQVIILDLMLPIDSKDTIGPQFPEGEKEVAGAQLARTFREKGVDLNKIIAITTLAADRHLHSTRNLGISHILSKPVSFREVLSLIAKIIAQDK